jgi:hypothetical protein
LERKQFSELSRIALLTFAQRAKINAKVFITKDHAFDSLVAFRLVRLWHRRRDHRRTSIDTPAIKGSIVHVRKKARTVMGVQWVDVLLDKDSPDLLPAKSQA